MEDEVANRGPLEGLRMGLLSVAAKRQWAYVTTCDSPWILPGVIELLYTRAANFDAAVATLEGHEYPLNAVYRSTVHREIEVLLAQGERRVRALFDRIRAARLTAEDLEVLDPEHLTFQNMNRPADYFSALARAGIEPDAKLRAEWSGK